MMAGTVALNSCGRSGVIVTISHPSILQPNKLILARSVLPEDYERDLYDVTGTIEVKMKVTKTAVKRTADKARADAAKQIAAEKKAAASAKKK